MVESTSSLPADLFDATTIYSLASTVVIVLAAVSLARASLPGHATAATRFLFIWHAADGLCHLFLEGGFLYHCFVSWIPAGGPTEGAADIYYPTPFNYLGHGAERVYGAQAGGDNPLARLWMVYARADARWGGIDLAVVALELLTVGLGVPFCAIICYCLAKQKPVANIWMIILATMELYGGFITFCPEWLVGNVNLDTSNFMYKWVYLVFFNMLWVFIPLYALFYSANQISAAFVAQSAKVKTR